jgi:hypothetical protein
LVGAPAVNHQIEGCSVVWKLDWLGHTVSLVKLILRWDGTGEDVSCTGSIPTPGCCHASTSGSLQQHTGQVLWPVQAGILKPTEPTWVESPTEPAVSLSPSSEGQSSDSHPTRVCPPALVLASAVVGTRWLLLGESQQANQTKGFQRYRCPDHATPHRQHTHTVILGRNACSTSGSARWRCW